MGLEEHKNLFFTQINQEEVEEGREQLLEKVQGSPMTHGCGQGKPEPQENVEETSPVEKSSETSKVLVRNVKFSGGDGARFCEISHGFYRAHFTCACR